MAEGYIAEIRSVAFDFAPKGWALCDGALLPLASNQPLFALIGTYYGGNGTTNFALPDLRGRVPVHRSSSMPQGLSGGQEAVTLTTAQMPFHTHPLAASGATGTNADPQGRFPALANGGQTLYAGGSPSGTQMAPTGPAGGNQPHNNMQPGLAINFVICLQGLFPSRN